MPPGHSSWNNIEFRRGIAVQYETVVRRSNKGGNHINPHQFSINATVPKPPSAHMLTIARLPLGSSASSLTA